MKYFPPQLHLFNIFDRYTADDNGYRADVSYLVKKQTAYRSSPPKSKFIDAKSTPLVVDHSSLFLYQPKERSLEERKSISAKPTYIVSHKLTSVNQNSNVLVN